jgi:hypothetical protein
MIAGEFEVGPGVACLDGLAESHTLFPISWSDTLGTRGAGAGGCCSSSAGCHGLLLDSLTLSCEKEVVGTDGIGGVSEDCRSPLSPEDIDLLNGFVSVRLPPGLRTVGTRRMSLPSSTPVSGSAPATLPPPGLSTVGTRFTSPLAAPESAQTFSSSKSEYFELVAEPGLRAAGTASGAGARASDRCCASAPQTFSGSDCWRAGCILTCDAGSIAAFCGSGLRVTIVAGTMVWRGSLRGRTDLTGCEMSGSFVSIARARRRSAEEYSRSE